ncbi:hypothetical protein RGUI_3384 [Rhodovulum sp. P5]|nr:hypothetical protein RGUI_3384 [Rhodovulum sp. P5]
MIGHDRQEYTLSALEATALQFLGPFAPGGGSGGGGGAGLGVDDLAPDSDTPYDLTKDRLLGIALVAKYPLSNRVSALADVDLSYGQSRYNLPEGIGVFVDPTVIEFNTFALTPEIGVAARLWETGAIRVDGEMALCRQYAKTRTKVSSALLDIKNVSYPEIGCTRLGLDVSSPRLPGKLRVNIRHDTSDIWQVRAELRVPLR